MMLVTPAQSFLDAEHERAQHLQKSSVNDQYPERDGTISELAKLRVTNNAPCRDLESIRKG